jgi:hypothetical protein
LVLYIQDQAKYFYQNKQREHTDNMNHNNFLQTITPIATQTLKAQPQHYGQSPHSPLIATGVTMGLHAASNAGYIPSPLAHSIGGVVNQNLNTYSQQHQAYGQAPAHSPVHYVPQKQQPYHPQQKQHPQQQHLPQQQTYGMPQHPQVYHPQPQHPQPAHQPQHPQHPQQYHQPAHQPYNNPIAPNAYLTVTHPQYHSSPHTPTGQYPSSPSHAPSPQYHSSPHTPTGQYPSSPQKYDPYMQHPPIVPPQHYPSAHDAPQQPLYNVAPQQSYQSQPSPQQHHSIPQPPYNPTYAQPQQQQYY